MVLLFAILAECESVNEKILVFSQSLFTLDLIEEHLSMQNWVKGKDFFRLDGKTKIELRKKHCDKFNNIKKPRARWVYMICNIMRFVFLSHQPHVYFSDFF